MKLMGIDIGTTGCKAAVFDDSGKQLTFAYREYPLQFLQKGWMELDPERVFDSILNCIKECIGVSGGEIASLAVSCQGEAMIPVDRNGTVLHNAIVTFDVRNTEQFIRFSTCFDAIEVMKITGTPVHPMFSITKLMWIKDNKPEIYEKTWKFLSFAEFITYRLGAQPIMDYSMASRTLAFDIHNRCWSQSILDKIGIEIQKLPETIQPGTPIGHASQEIANKLGFIGTPLITAGGHDQSCCALGAGVLENGSVMCSLGTTESILCVYRDAVISTDMIKNNIPCGIYTARNLYVYLSFLSCCGSILKWYTDKFLGRREPNSFKELDIGAAALPQGPSSLFVLPYFSGSGTPYLDFSSRGVIAGLTLDTDKYEVYKAILESICLESRLNIECMEKSGIEVKELRCIGGGSNSPFWLQLMSDITGKPVTALEIGESGCLGAAILAGIGCGVYPDEVSASKRYFRVREQYQPDPDMHIQYTKIYKKYKLLYASFKTIFNGE